MARRRKAGRLRAQGLNRTSVQGLAVPLSQRMGAVGARWLASVGAYDRAGNGKSAPAIVAASPFRSVPLRSCRAGPAGRGPCASTLVSPLVHTLALMFQGLVEHPERLPCSALGRVA